MGFNLSSEDKTLIAEQQLERVKKETGVFRRGDPRQNLKKAREEREQARFEASPAGRQWKKSHKSAFGVGKQVARAAAVAMRPPVSFSKEQEMLGQMFGHGDKIWGTNMEPVRINNDLNSSRSDPEDETADMFGFGPRGERSGMF